MRTLLRLCLAVSLTIAAIGTTVSSNAETTADDLIPLLHSPTPIGRWHTEPAGTSAVGARVVDGSIDDWAGTATDFSGTSIVSHGEWIYTDHVFDAYGADDGADAERVATFGPVWDAVPQTYRVEPLFQADVPDEFGAPNPYPVEEQYGDAGSQPLADLTELRIAADEDTVYVLARTSVMHEPTDAAVLLLADTDGAAPMTRPVPFNAGISTQTGDVAILLAHDAGRAIDLVSGAETSVPAVAQPDGYVNAIEASIPRHLIERADGTLSFSVATGLFAPSTAGFADLDGANLANVALRYQEPVRIWFDLQQGLALYEGSIDRFTDAVSLTALAAGATERFVPDSGYFERLFTSSEQISYEGGTEGIRQHYGVYLPVGYGASAANVPMTMWFHWRGGKAHSAATMIPQLMRDMGEGLGGIVVSPRGRGTSSWYLGKGQQDFREVWDDATSAFRVDRDRVYSTGHSMGGWASYLMPILYPDRFAASFPVSPPVTQGAWTGLDFPGCDDYQYDEYTFCYVYTNDSNPRAQHTRPLLENLRNVPIAIYAGGIDELVPISGEIRQAERLVDLGYRHRLYIFPNYEHFTPPIVDQWMEGVRYFQASKREANPAQVSYIRDMVFEHSVEIGPSQFNNPFPGLNFDFDAAYWMSGLTPTDPDKGRAHFEGRSFAIAGPATITVPEVGGPAAPGQAGPFVMTGLAWIDDPLAAAIAPTNSFEATLTGATAVILDLDRMQIDTTKPITGSVTFDHAATLTLTGAWSSAPSVTIGGAPATATYSDGTLSITVPAGSSNLSIT